MRHSGLRLVPDVAGCFSFTRLAHHLVSLFFGLEKFHEINFVFPKEITKLTIGSILIQLFGKC